MNYWLMKTEPDVFSIDDLKNSKNQISSWDGVRNYQARNFMMKDMKVGDKVLIYHSNATPPGVAGVAVVASGPKPDFSAWDIKSKYFDPKSPEDKPRWFLVDVKFDQKFSRLIPLEELKTANELKEMLILRKGNRLSITPLQKKEFEFISKLATKQKK